MNTVMKVSNKGKKTAEVKNKNLLLVLSDSGKDHRVEVCLIRFFFSAKKFHPLGILRKNHVIIIKSCQYCVTSTVIVNVLFIT